jgi:galactokinase
VDARQLFQQRFGGPPVAVASAPGRINLIGEHTDYNGGLVLPLAISQRLEVALRLTPDERVRGVSGDAGPAEAALGEAARGDWLDYPRGVARELAAAGRIPAGGFELAVSSAVAQGAGLSSSAALEVASALALLAAAGSPARDDERAWLATLCRRAEADFVGVPCGLMDPFALLHARPGCAVKLDCASLEWQRVPLPEDLELLIVDTGVAHALRQGGYAERLAECRTALEAAQRALRRPLGQLVELTEAELERLRPELEDRAWRRARHVVRENARVGAFVRAVSEGDLAAAGGLMYASHASLRDDYEVTWPEADALIEASREIPGVAGARMTGAGWGGCTIHWVERARIGDAARRLAARFSGRFGRPPRWWLAGAADAARLEDLGEVV